MATEEQLLVYTCDVCDYRNEWTRDQIVQRGRREIYRDGDPVGNMDIYSLPCQNPKRPGCTARQRVGVPRRENRS